MRQHYSVLISVPTIAAVACGSALRAQASALSREQSRPVLFGFALECNRCGPSAASESFEWHYGEAPRVVAVAPGGPAARAGVRVGDTIMSVDGFSLLTADGARLLTASRPGDRLRLTIHRDGAAIDVPVTLMPVIAVPTTASCIGARAQDIHSSMHSALQMDRGDRRWSVSWSSSNCGADLVAIGGVVLRPDLSDVLSVAPGGRFEVSARDGSMLRQLVVFPADGALVRQWTVDGKRAPWTEEARAWLGDFLIALDRHTGFACDLRFPELMTAGGVDAVLEETARMTDDLARGRYYTRLLDSASFGAAEYHKLLVQLDEKMASSPERARLLSAVAHRSGLQEDLLRIDVVRNAAKLIPPQRSTALMMVIDRGGRPLSHALARALLDASSSLTDPELERFLAALVDSGDVLAAGDIAAAIVTAARIRPEPMRARVLLAVAANYRLEAETRTAYSNAADSFRTQTLRLRVLQPLVRQEK